MFTLKRGPDRQNATVDHSYIRELVATCPRYVASAAESYYVSVEVDTELAAASIEGIYDGEGAAIERRIEHSGMAAKRDKLQDRNNRPWCCQAERFAE